MRSKIGLVAVAALAVALPVQASAKSVHGNSGKGAAKGKNNVAAGTVSAVDAAGGLVTVSVQSGNHAARAFQGQDVQFNVAGSHLQIGDANADGTADLNDVTVGDSAQVQWRATSSATQPLAARRFKDSTSLDDGTDDDTGDTPPTP